MNITLYYDRDPEANPYYADASRLHRCASLVQELEGHGEVRVLRWAGGHRSPLQQDCVCELSLAATEPDDSRDLLDRLCAKHGANWCFTKENSL